MRQYIKGRYVISEMANAFNGKHSWWISRDGMAVAYYCFSTNVQYGESYAERELEQQIAAFDGYIKMFNIKADGEEMPKEYEGDLKQAVTCVEV